MRLSPAPLLVLGVGNPSRGDDALGPLFIERAAEALKERVAAGELELLTDFQLQIEHALDLEGRRRVVFVDASLLEPWFPAYSAEHRFQETRGCLQPLPGRGRGPAPGPDPESGAGPVIERVASAAERPVRATEGLERDHAKRAGEICTKPRRQGTS